MKKLYIIALASALGACSQPLNPCQVDSDCRAGLYCDRVYGECIEEIYVFRCGNERCLWPDEQCRDNRCITRDAAVEDLSDATINEIRYDSGTYKPPTGDADIDDEPDAGIIFPTPLVLLEEPFPNSVYFDKAVTVQGSVLELHELGTVSLLIDNQQPIYLQLDTEGRFSRYLNLDAGKHTISIVAENGDQKDERSVNIRVDYHVTAMQEQFIMNNRPFRFVGLNVPELMEDAHSDLVNGTNRVAEVMSEAKEMGVTVLRTRAFDDRSNSEVSVLQTPNLGSSSLEAQANAYYNAAGLQAHDYIIKMAGEYGLKLIIPLLGGAQFGGQQSYLDWNTPDPENAPAASTYFSAGPIREQLKNNVAFMVGRQNAITGMNNREDPTILAWEIIDGPVTKGVLVDNGVAARSFLTELAQTILNNDSYHLIGTGEIGFDINPTPYDPYTASFIAEDVQAPYGGHHIAWLTNQQQISAISYKGIQVLPTELEFPQQATKLSNLGADWIQGHASASSTIRQPFVVSSSYIPSTDLQPTNRANVLKAWTDTFSMLGLSGFIFGDFYSDATFDRTNVRAWSVPNGTSPTSSSNPLSDRLHTTATGLSSGN